MTVTIACGKIIISIPMLLCILNWITLIPAPVFLDTLIMSFKQM